MNYQQAVEMLNLLRSIDKRLAAVEQARDHPPVTVGALEPAASYADDLSGIKRIAGAFPPLIDINSRRYLPDTAGQMKPHSGDFT